MLSKLKTRLRALLRKSKMERELDEELRYHIEQQTEQNIRLGINPKRRVTMLTRLSAARFIPPANIPSGGPRSVIQLRPNHDKENNWRLPPPSFRIKLPKVF